MDKNLVLIENIDKEHIDTLKYKFQFYLILEKIYRESFYIDDIYIFLNNIFSFLKVYNPENDFRLSIEDEIDFDTGIIEDKIIYKKELIFSEIPFGNIIISGRELNEIKRNILEHVFSHILINIVFYRFKKIFNIKENIENISDIDLEFERLELEKVMRLIAKRATEDIRCENVYFFSWRDRQYHYILNHLNKEVSIKDEYDKEYLNDMLSRSFKKSVNYIELSKEDRLVFSRILGVKVKNFILTGIRSIEEFQGVVLHINSEGMNLQSEKIIDLYSMYLERCFLAINRYYVNSKAKGILKMYSCASQLVEKRSQDQNIVLDRFFKVFKNYFDLEEIACFFLRNDERLEDIYSSSYVLKKMYDLIDGNEKNGIIKDDNKFSYHYSFFYVSGEKKGLLIFRSKNILNRNNIISIRQLGSLFFNIFYSNRIYEKIKQLDRLAVLGQMSREMAHEIRNPLGGIKLYIEMLEKRSKEDKEIFESIHRGIDNINSVINNMLDFTKEEKPYIKREELNSVINEAISIIPELNKIHINYITNDKIYINIDRNKMIRVFLNILKNAYEVFDNKDKNDIITIQAYKNEENVIVEIWNNGGEISQKDRANIFAPFYTTKKNGNGLGMAIVRKILDSHDAIIKIKTANGCTGFKIIF